MARLLVRQGEMLDDVGPGPVPRGQIPIGAKLLVRLDDEVARDAELDSQSAGGRQTRPGRQRAAQDCAAQRVADLLEQRSAVRAIEVQPEIHARPKWSARMARM